MNTKKNTLTIVVATIVDKDQFKGHTKLTQQWSDLAIEMIDYFTFVIDGADN